MAVAHQRSHTAALARARPTARAGRFATGQGGLIMWKSAMARHSVDSAGVPGTVCIAGHIDDFSCMRSGDAVSLRTIRRNASMAGGRNCDTPTARKHLDSQAQLRADKFLPQTLRADKFLPQTQVPAADTKATGTSWGFNTIHTATILWISSAPLRTSAMASRLSSTRPQKEASRLRGSLSSLAGLQW
jgi:hypothetical protein